MPLPPQNRSFYDALVLYTKQRRLRTGKALHSQIITGGASSCTYLANNLINFYAKCGRLPQAKRVFDGILTKDVVSWNCLINGFSQIGPSGSSSVMELFRGMRAANTLPNPHTFTGIFTAAALNLSSIEGGRQAHALAVKTGSFYDVFVGSSALNMYCKAGLVLEARNVFDRMPERNSVSWATMISGYATQRLASEAFRVFELLHGEEEDVNEFVVTGVLSALAVPELVDGGRIIHCLAVKTGMLHFVSVLNALVTMYAKCGSLHDSFQMFDLSSEKNSITWSAVINGFAQSEDSIKALELFSRLHFDGIDPHEFTILGALNACADNGAGEEGKQVHGLLLKLGFESQMYIITALVDMYAKCGCTEDAQKGFNCLQEPDIVLWTSMISGYVQNGENEEALNLYGRMHIDGVFPNELTMASVLKACSCLAALDQGKQIHTLTIKYGLRPEGQIGCSLSTMYAKCGSLEEANLVFRSLLERDIITWNAMISGLSHNGCGKEALELFEEMRLEGTKPDYVTFVNILSACSHIGVVERGWSYFHMMSDEFGLVPRVEHYACMVDILGRAGKLNEAKEFIESARIDHGLSLWRILLGACRNYRHYELGAYAGEKLMELGSRESSTYVLLSGIYTALGRPEDVERVRSVMNARRVSKEPGCSWIELKGHVHVFVVGDQMHPQIPEIRAEVRSLSRQMKDVVYQPPSDSESTLSILQSC